MEPRLRLVGKLPQNVSVADDGLEPPSRLFDGVYVTTPSRRREVTVADSHCS